MSNGIEKGPSLEREEEEGEENLEELSVSELEERRKEAANRSLELLKERDDIHKAYEEAFKAGNREKMNEFFNKEMRLYDELRDLIERRNEIGNVLIEKEGKMKAQETEEEIKQAREEIDKKFEEE